jgi:chaperonin cofactor prefoldin
MAHSGSWHWALQIFCVCLLQDLACKVEWLMSEKSAVESELKDLLAQKKDLDEQLKDNEYRMKELESQLEKEKSNRLYQLLGMLML